MSVRSPSVRSSSASTASRWSPMVLPLAAVALLLTFSTASPIAAQNEIGGRVVDAVSNQGIASAQVSIVGTGQGGLPQANGRFLLLNVVDSRSNRPIEAGSAEGGVLRWDAEGGWVESRS